MESPGIPGRFTGIVSVSTVVNALFGLFLAAAVAFAQTAPVDDPVPQIVQITVHGAGAFGADATMTTEVFKPDGDGPFPVVLYSHGRAATEAERRDMKVPILRGYVHYWTDKGFAVVAPIRPGYGVTRGADRELVGARYDQFGNCRGRPDLVAPTRNGVAATTAALDWVRMQKWADAQRILLVGTSMGGLVSVATAATNPPGVVGYINLAGGAGGDPARAPGRELWRRRHGGVDARVRQDHAHTGSLTIRAKRSLLGCRFTGVPKHPACGTRPTCKVAQPRRSSCRPLLFPMPTATSCLPAAASFGRCTLTNS
jgi:dienelactone hydrolase